MKEAEIKPKKCRTQNSNERKQQDAQRKKLNEMEQKRLETESLLFNGFGKSSIDLFWKWEQYPISYFCSRLLSLSPLFLSSLLLLISWVIIIMKIDTPQTNCTTSLANVQWLDIILTTWRIAKHTKFISINSYYVYICMHVYSISAYNAVIIIFLLSGQMKITHAFQADSSTHPTSSSL